MHLKAYYSRAWGHGVHPKAYYWRVWSTEYILRPTIRGLGLLFKGLEHGMNLKAYYSRVWHEMHLKVHFAMLCNVGNIGYQAFEK